MHVAVVRGFVNFTVNDPRAQTLLSWVDNTNIPDETFFSTMNHNPEKLPAPGAYFGTYPCCSRRAVSPVRGVMFRVLRDLPRVPRLSRFPLPWSHRFVESTVWETHGMRIAGHGGLFRNVPQDAATLRYFRTSCHFRPHFVRVKKLA